MFWETLARGVHEDAAWHAPPTQTPLYTSSWERNYQMAVVPPNRIIHSTTPPHLIQHPRRLRLATHKTHRIRLQRARHQTSAPESLITALYFSAWLNDDLSLITLYFLLAWGTLETNLTANLNIWESSSLHWLMFSTPLVSLLLTVCQFFFWPVIAIIIFSFFQ